MFHTKPCVYLLAAGAFVFLIQHGPSASAADRKPPALKDANRPDLVIQSLSGSNVHCEGGNKAFVKVTAVVKNVSTKAAADLSKNNPWNVVLRFQPGGAVTKCPGVIQVQDVGGPPVLGPGADFKGSATVCVAWPGGYASHVAVTVDPNNVVAERNESNNYSALPSSFSNPCH